MAEDNNQQERELRITWPHNPLAKNLKRQEIRKLFKQKLPDDPIDGDPCANVGYVLVRMATIEGAKNSIKSFNGLYFMGRTLEVAFSKREGLIEQTRPRHDVEEGEQSPLDSSLRAIQNGLLDDLASNIIRSPSAGYATAGVGRGRGFCGRGRGRGTNSFGASSRMTSTSNKPPQSEEAYINSLQQAYINNPQKPVKPKPVKPVKPGSGHPPSIVVRIVSGLNRKLDRFETLNEVRAYVALATSIQIKFSGTDDLPLNRRTFINARMETQEMADLIVSHLKDFPTENGDLLSAYYAGPDVLERMEKRDEREIQFLRDRPPRQLQPRYNHVLHDWTMMCSDVDPREKLPEHRRPNMGLISVN